MACLGYFSCGAHEVGLAEQLSGFHAQFAAYHFLVELVVAVDDDVVDACLRALGDAHFKRYAVAFDFAFDGYEVEEQIAVVHVEVAHGVVVLGEALVHVLLVVYVAGLHVEVGGEHVRRVYRVAHPADVLDVIAVSFVEFYVHVDGLFVVRYHAVGTMRASR